MDEPTKTHLNPQGGIIMADNLPQTNKQEVLPEPFPHVPSPSPETFVIPSSVPEKTPPVSAPHAPPINPFIPQGVVPAQTHGNTKVPAGRPAGSPIKKLLIILLFLLVFGGFILGGLFLLRKMQGPAEVTLTYWGLWEEDAVVRSVLSDFEAKNPKVKVQYVKNSHQQYRERLQAAINRGDGPDVFRFHNTWIPMFRNELATAPQGFMTANEFASTFYPVASADLVAGQSIFGVPMMIDGLGLYYNEELFATAGVTPPTTWEEVLGIVPKLTVKASDGTIVTSAIALGTTGNIENFSDILATMMMQNGVKLTNPIGKPAEEALIFYRKFADPSDPVYTWNDSLDNSIYAFATGRVAMILAPSWRAFEITELSKNNGKEVRFQIAPVPQLPGNTVSWASYWVEGVSSKTKNQLEAWNLVKFLTSKETVTKLYTEAGKTRLFGEPYARLDMAGSVASDPYVGAFVAQGAHARSFPLASRTFDNGLNDRMIKYLVDAVNGVHEGTAPGAVLETLKSGFDQVLGSFGLSTGTAPASP